MQMGVFPNWNLTFGARILNFENFFVILQYNLVIGLKQQSIFKRLLV